MAHEERGLIRPAERRDAKSIAAIYAQYVRSGTMTFEIDPVDEEEIARRIDAVRERGLPYLIIDIESTIAGYAYASPFRPRAAYRYTVEDSVYIDPSFWRLGIGGRLLAAVIEGARAGGGKQMIAAIGGDNPGSIALHQAHGFTIAGVLKDVGWKLDQWLDVTLMQRAL